jgi:hypothetical protein
MWASDYIEAVDRLVDSSKTDIDIEAEWNTLRAELAGVQQARKRGRPRKNSAPQDAGRPAVT